VDSNNWSLGLIRRVKRANQRERIYLGLETLSSRPVAASIRPVDIKLIDPTLPPDMVGCPGIFPCLYRLIVEGGVSTP
jgi:hypothetical protein